VDAGPRVSTETRAGRRDPAPAVCAGRTGEVRPRSISLPFRGSLALRDCGSGLEAEAQEVILAAARGDVARGHAGGPGGGVAAGDVLPAEVSLWRRGEVGAVVRHHESQHRNWRHASQFSPRQQPSAGGRPPPLGGLRRLPVHPTARPGPDCEPLGIGSVAWPPRPPWARWAGSEHFHLGRETFRLRLHRRHGPAQQVASCLRTRFRAGTGGATRDETPGNRQRKLSRSV
jgi:hypothetical protein